MTVVVADGVAEAEGAWVEDADSAAGDLGASAAGVFNQLGDCT